MRVGPLCVFRPGHLVIGQGVLQCAFAEFGEIAQARQDNVGGHTVKLRGAAGDPIKFLDRQLQCTVLIGTAAQQRSEAADRENRLHRAFTESVLVTDDHRATIILESSCENFAGRGALPAGQNHERPRISHADGVGRNSDASVIIFRLNDRA